MESPQQQRAQGCFQPAVQIEGIERLSPGAQFTLGLGVDGVALQQPVTWSRGPVMPSSDFRSMTIFAQQFGRSTEVIVERFPYLTIDRVDLRDHLRVFQSFVAQQLPHVRPVLLLDVPVVVFVVGARPCEADCFWPLLEVAHQMPVEELAAVIAVEAFDGEGQRGFHFARGFHDAVRSFVPHGAQARPAAVDVGVGHAPDETALQRASAVRHGVGFKEPGPGDVPVVGANRDVVLEQAPGLGATATTMLALGFARG